MVMVPLVLHAAACWEKDWGSRRGRGIERDADTSSDSR